MTWRTGIWSSSAAGLVHSDVERSGVELGGGDSAPGGLGSGVQASVPNGDDQAGVADCQRAGEMDSVGSAQGMGSGEATGVLFNRRGEFDWAG